MDTIHPAIVHIPMALSILMPLIAGGITVAWWRGWLSPKAWVIAVALQGVLVASGAMSMQTGEQDEDRVERIVPERFIEEHEEAAEAFIWAGGGVFALMLVGLLASGRREGIPLAGAATLATLVVLGLGYRTGQAGGALVYEHGAANAFANGGAGNSGIFKVEGYSKRNENHGHDEGHDDD